MNKSKSKIIQIATLLLLSALYWYFNQAPVNYSNSVETNSGEAKNQVQILEQYYKNKTSKKMIQLTGTVIKLLSDDLIEPRHQKFIIKTSTKMSLLVTHNIDLAPRINSINEGDEVLIYGQYEWNDKGGLLHWTHHDPKKRRAGGWIIHNGKKYE